MNAARKQKPTRLDGVGSITFGDSGRLSDAHPCSAAATAAHTQAACERADHRWLVSKSSLESAPRQCQLRTVTRLFLRKGTTCRAPATGLRRWGGFTAR